MNDPNVQINIQVRQSVREDFRVAAKLRGASMSGLLFQYIMKVIREEKTHSPQEFPDYTQVPEIISDKAKIRDRIQARYETFGGKQLTRDQMDKMIDKIAELLEVVEIPNESQNEE